MLQTKFNLPSIYNPANQTKEELIANFVVRKKELNNIFHAIKNDDTQKPPQHFIIEGLRGSGKTTLLLRLYYEIYDDAILNKQIIPVMFDEEQYHIRTLYKLWENIASYLEDQNGETFFGIYDEMQKYLKCKDYEEKCYEILITYLLKNKKNLVLLIDNFGEMLKKFQMKEHQRLREILTVCNYIRIVGASSVVLEFNYDYTQPFFEFFKVIHLEDLSRKETISLLQRLGRTYKSNVVHDIVKNEPGRIEALRRLTNGIPRSIVLLFEIFVDNESGDSFKDLEMILDKVTPLYKHRMDGLSAPQQEIIDTIAINWDAVGVKEITKKTRIESKVASAQIKQLEKNRIVTKIPTSTKNYFYQINERFFNIWYLMRYGRKKERNRVLWLVRFLENWCSKEELISRARKHLQALRKGMIYEKHALYLTEALSWTPIPGDIQDELIRETRQFLTKRKSELLKELSQSDLEYFEEADRHYKRNEYKNMLHELLKIRNKTGFVLYDIAFLYYQELKDFEKAEQYYLKAIDEDDSYAMNNLASLYRAEFKDFEKAKRYYLMAIDKGHSTSMYNLAVLYEIEFKDFKRAKKYYLMAAKKNNYNAMNRIAWSYFIEKKNKSRSLEFSKKSFNNKNEIYSAHTYATVLLWNNEIEEAIRVSKYFMDSSKAFSEFGEDVELFLMLLIAKKQYNYTYRLFNENKFDIKDKLKPIYYALMYFMQDTHPNEYKKMGSELKQTVEEIVESIKQLAIDYR